jgi:hypothetical protein
MDSDFADFLLDDSHIHDMKQKQVCEIEDIQFSSQDFEDDFQDVEQLERKELRESAFDVTFEICEDDLLQLEYQKPANEVGGSKALLDELEAQKRLIMSKEGEITILRQRLHQLDGEKMSFAQKIAELSEQNAVDSRRIEEKYRNELNKVQAEIKFKEQELNFMNRPRKQARTIETSISSEKPVPVTPVTKLIQPRLSDLDLFYLACQRVDTNLWDFSRIGHFEVIDIMKGREVAKQAIIIENSLPSGLIALLKYACQLRQPRLMIYTFFLIRILADEHGNRLFESPEKSCEIYNLLLKVVLERVLLKGIPKEVISSFLLILQVVLFRSDWKLPSDFAKLVKSGFLQWILRCECLTASELTLLCRTLYALSLDVSAVSKVFLQAETDKIASSAVLDLLHSRALSLLYKIAKEPKEDSILQADAVASLLFSFVHRKLGPSTLWFPNDLVKQLVEWTIFTVSSKPLARESPCLLIAKESLIATVVDGLLCIWSSNSLAPVLKILRMPFGGALKLISSSSTPFNCKALLDSALKLFKLIEREVADDMRSLYETGQLTLKQV